MFGIPDAKYGEQVCAWVVPLEGAELTPEEVIAFCNGQIAHFKVPRHVRIVGELPMTVTGKPQKFVMRNRDAEVDGEGGVCGRGAESLSYASERRHQSSFLHSCIRATTSAADCTRLTTTRGLPRTRISSTAAVSCVCS